jgi:propanol-preferring alcohol dehydrogenase
MKSWRFFGTDKPLELLDVEEPHAGPGQVIVDVKAAHSSTRAGCRSSPASP